MVTYHKPQSPIQSGEDFIYPITTADQIKKSDNSRRLEQAGLIVADNSTSLGGIAASEYALKTKTVPTSRTVNGKALSENIALTASDVGARNETWLPSTDNLRSIQMASWKGNTKPSDLPAGITHVSVSGSGKDEGFPVGYATCVAVNLDPSRCIQLLIEKTSGKLWIRSSTDGSSWGSWQSYLPSNELVQKSDVVDLTKITSGTRLTGMVPSAQALMDCIYAKRGTKFSRFDKVPYAGILTSSAKSLRFCIPVPYVVNNGSTVTFTRLTGGIRVSGGGYISDGITASDSSEWLSGPAVNTVTGTIYKGILYLNIEMKNAVDNASNNTPINAQLGIEFTVN